MSGISFQFLSVAEAISALYEKQEPMGLIRLGKTSVDDLVLAINAEAMRDVNFPRPGDSPDQRRDTSRTADIEIEYMKRMLVERGCARQVMASQGDRFVELAFHRVFIHRDEELYAFTHAVRTGTFDSFEVTEEPPDWVYQK